MSPHTLAVSPALQDTINRYSPYLTEIRKRLLFLTCLFLIAASVGFIYYERIVTFILDFLNLEGVNVVFTSPFQFFTLAVNSAMFVGLLAIFPILVLQAISFFKPALSPKEYRAVITPLPLSLLLLAAGFAYGLIVMKYVVAIFYQKSLDLHIGNILDIELLLSKIVLTGTLMGLAFQFPIVMSILLHLRLVTLKTFTAQRPLAYAATMLFVMFLPPTDVLSDLLLVLPLVFLFEFTLLFNRLILRQRR